MQPLAKILNSAEVKNNAELLIFFPEPDCAVFVGTRAQLIEEGLPFPADFRFTTRRDVWSAGKIEYIAAKLSPRISAELGFKTACWEVIQRSIAR
jgi:hypothetical protein